jgi:hypothetical protein
MQLTLLALASIATLAVSDSFMLPFLSEDAALSPALPHSSRRFELQPAGLLAAGAACAPRPVWHNLSNAPVLSRISRNEINTRRVESMVLDLFAALLHADDCTLLERQTHGMGDVYLDTNFSMVRRPFLLRSGIRDIMSKYSLPLREIERKWTSCARNTSTTSAQA